MSELTTSTRNGTRPVPARLRFLISLALGLMAGLVAHMAATLHKQRDFSLVWYSARAVLHGQDPYALIGPGRAYEWVAGLFYPLPGVLVGIPFTPLPSAAACGIFMIVAGGCFAWALMETASRRSGATVPLRCTSPVRSYSGRRCSPPRSSSPHWPSSIG